MFNKLKTYSELFLRRYSSSEKYISNLKCGKLQEPPLQCVAGDMSKSYKKHPDVQFGYDKWARFPKYKPSTFYLVEIEDALGKRQKGWWTGQRWDFGKKRVDPEAVVRWRDLVEYSGG